MKQIAIRFSLLLMFLAALAEARPLGAEATLPADPAAELPEEVTLGDLLELLRHRSPRVAAERALVPVAEAGVIAAGLLPNPSVAYGGMAPMAGTNTIDGTQHLLTLEQPLLLAGQRGARLDVAERMVRATSASVEVQLAALTRTARQRFVDLQAAQERGRLLDEALLDLREIERVVEGRTLAGAMSEYDLVRVGVESAALDARRTAAHAELDDAAGQLAAVLGFPHWRPRALGELRPLGISDDAERLWRQAQEMLPVLRAAREHEAASRSAVELARRERWPVPVLAFGPYATTDEYSLSAFVGLSVPLPVFDRGQGLVAHAAAEARVAQRTRVATGAESQADLERAARLLAQQREALRAFERDVIGRLPRLRQMAADAYRTGQSGILELLDAFRTRTELELSHIDKIEAVMQAEVETLAAAGLIDALDTAAIHIFD